MFEMFPGINIGWKIGQWLAESLLGKAAVITSGGSIIDWVTNPTGVTTGAVTDPLGTSINSVTDVFKLLLSPPVIVASLFLMGCLFLFIGKRSLLKSVAGALMIGASIITFAKFFLGVTFIPGVFSIAGGTTGVTPATGVGWVFAVIAAYGVWAVLNKKNRR